jgi:fumarate hydratase class I
MNKLTLPISDKAIRELRVGDPVLLDGVMLTGRDAAHKWMVETWVKKTRQPSGDDLQVYEAIKPLLQGGAIYHCGPVVAGLDTKQYKFVAAGPTTSTREEPYQGDVMRHFNLKAVIGKGGMGKKTSEACAQVRRLSPRHRWRSITHRANGDTGPWRIQARIRRARSILGNRGR